MVRQYFSTPKLEIDGLMIEGMIKVSVVEKSLMQVQWYHNLTQRTVVFADDEAVS